MVTWLACAPGRGHGEWPTSGVSYRRLTCALQLSLYHLRSTASSHPLMHRYDRLRGSAETATAVRSTRTGVTEYRKRLTRRRAVRHRGVRHRPIRHRKVRHRPFRHRQVRHRPIRHRQVRHRPIKHRQVRHRFVPVGRRPNTASTTRNTVITPVVSASPRNTASNEKPASTSTPTTTPPTARMGIIVPLNTA